VQLNGHIIGPKWITLSGVTGIQKGSGCCMLILDVSKNNGVVEKDWAINF
jgi:hypothetical protein